MFITNTAKGSDYYPITNYVYILYIVLPKYVIAQLDYVPWQNILRAKGSQGGGWGEWWPYKA